MQTELMDSSTDSEWVQIGSYSENDIEQHADWNVGDMLFNNRYYVRRLLGQGSFGRVLEVIDTKEKSVKAIKIVKPGTYMREAKQEEKIIRLLNQNDIEDVHGIIRLHHSFHY